MVPKELAKRVKELEDTIKQLTAEVREFKQGMRKAVTKVGVVRFNPFKGTGSDQSFAIALLNQDNNGFVITSHYFQDHNRVYSKPVAAGKSDYSLAQEEQDAIAKAIANNALN